MAFVFVVAGVVIGLAVFVLLVQMAVRNGIRMSGLIDWRTQYELERIDEAGGNVPSLAELYESVSKDGLEPEVVERKVRARALRYIDSRNSVHVRNCWIVVGTTVGVCLLLLIGSVADGSL